MDIARRHARRHRDNCQLRRTSTPKKHQYKRKDSCPNSLFARHRGPAHQLITGEVAGVAPAATATAATVTVAELITVAVEVGIHPQPPAAATTATVLPTTEHEQ